jgi:hypothetical protein
MGGYALVLVAFTFFARFFNDNYFGVDVTVLLCIRPLGQQLMAPAMTEPVEQLAAA